MSSPVTYRATLREGIALPIALAAIVVVGALIAGVFFASTQEYRVGRNIIAAHTAMPGAEVGLNSVVSSWTPDRTKGLKIGFRDSLRDTIIDGSYVKREWVRVSPTMFWVTSTAIGGTQSLQNRALKRLNTLVRVDVPDLRVAGAVTSRGRTEIAGASKVSGTDTVLRGWDCPPGGPAGAGVVVNDSASNMIYSGVNYRLNGDPKVADMTATVKDTTTFLNFGGFTYDSLAKLATRIRTAPGAISVNPSWISPGVCNTNDLNNWGDTSHVNGPRGCENFYPIVHLQGTTNNYNLQGTSGGQGIILVDGNLTIAGGFRWTGLIIVKGSTVVAGTAGQGGVKLVGGLMSMNRLSPADSNQITGASSITYSRCVINMITSRLATARQTRYRAWADMSF
jgi:hypothetical protein